ncbi:hypothetical protein [Microcoleus sp. PH2017_36_ELK_O_B]|nr:hypothetical protein [Microcoleus sp. PH2017_36_ELK_O_B]
MQETKENSLFTYGRENCGRRRRWVVYRRNCDGSFRKVVRYGYW